METAVMLRSLQDPMGIPFYPVLFQLLMVLTFALHILFANFTVGTSALALYGHFKRGDDWRHLSGALAKAAPANVSMAMLLGIAPLLFVQVVYDPFWYASNSLSAAWVIAFIGIMAAAYSSLYLFYLGRQKTGGTGRTLFGVIAVALFIVAAIVMHVLSYQALQPEKWLDWYARGNVVDTSGVSLHAFQLPRFLHFIIPSFAMTGIFMMLYAWYFKDRKDKAKGYLSWVGAIGAKMAFLFTAVQALVGFWWVLALPAEFNFIANPLFLVAAALGVALLFLLYSAQKDPVRYAVPSALAAFITIFGMSYAREMLRMLYAGRFNYSIFQYKLNIDWGSTLLFLVTFVMGIVIVSYLLTVAFKSGRNEAVYTASPAVQTLGKVSIGLLLLWILVVAGLGLFISIKNYML